MSLQLIIRHFGLDSRNSQRNGYNNCRNQFQHVRREHIGFCCQGNNIAVHNGTHNGWILGYLADHENEEIYQKDIEEKFCVTRSTVSKVLKGMESKGLLRRESVSSDARLKRLVLTEEGREINANAAVERIELENRIRDGLSKTYRYWQRKTPVPYNRYPDAGSLQNQMKLVQGWLMRLKNAVMKHLDFLPVSL